MSDCTEIYGRKNDLGESPEMMLSQKSAMRPAKPGAAGGEPFRPHRLREGILVERERPEYGEVYRARIAQTAAGEKRR
jgi:2-oxoglutarate ferredoxin oxidoreductase subunit beta